MTSVDFTARFPTCPSLIRRTIFRVFIRSFVAVVLSAGSLLYSFILLLPRESKVKWPFCGRPCLANC